MAGLCLIISALPEIFMLFLGIRAELTYALGQILSDATFTLTPSEFYTRDLDINRLKEYIFEIIENVRLEARYSGCHRMVFHTAGLALIPEKYMRNLYLKNGGVRAYFSLNISAIPCFCNPSTDFPYRQSPACAIVTCRKVRR
jgi:hypothetical protein